MLGWFNVGSLLAVGLDCQAHGTNGGKNPQLFDFQINLAFISISFGISLAQKKWRTLIDEILWKINLGKIKRKLTLNAFGLPGAILRH